MKYDYDLIVIGGGAAGLVAATGANLLGAKCALVERSRLGGDCTWYGCIPSKALLKSAHVFSLIKRLGEFGISASGDIKYDADNVMSHVRDIINKISSNHPPEVFKKRGIDIFFGGPRFINCNTIQLNKSLLSAKRFIICTGSHPLVPPIEGLKNIDYLTNANIFYLNTLPKSLAVLGGGPIGLELSQAFARLGVKVYVIEMLDRLLFREDEEIAKTLQNAIIKEGVEVHVGKKAVKFSKEEDLVVITLEDKNKNKSVIKAEKTLIAIGRAPNIEDLDLEKAGVKYSKKGIETNATLQTSTKNIYACGDVVGPYQFSHVAEYQAIVAIGNALFPFKQKVNYTAVPWCTFTEPEVAHLGLTEEEARAKYKDIKIYRANYAENDRAVTDLEEIGFSKVICNKKGRILGAHIVGTNAGEIIHEYVLAKSAGLNVGKLSSAIHIYPTLAQIVKKTGDKHYSSILESKWFKALAKFFIKILK